MRQAFLLHMLPLFFCAMVCGYLSWLNLNDLKISARNWIQDDRQEPRYLPDIQHVRLVTLGFNRMFADILWFDTLNYFGKQYLADKDYDWLNYRCNLVTALDPGAIHVYEFCAPLLSWMVKAPLLSNSLLTRGIEAKPDYWRFYYLRAFNYWYFLEDKAAAKDDLERSTKCPDVPDFVFSLASRLLVDVSGARAAVDFLSQTLENTKDNLTRKALEEKLRLAIISRDVEFLQEGLTKFREKMGYSARALNELVSEKIITSLPKDPDRNDYLLTDKLEVISPSGESGLNFKGKTAKTGFLRNEFQ